MKQWKVAMSGPDIDQGDIDAVVEVLGSGQLALGDRARDFERLVAGRVGTEHAVAVSSGTAALHLAIRALGISPGDEVLVPSFTFAASVNAILYVGALPVFVDIQPDTFNLDPDDLERKATAATKAVMVVDIFGHPADWDEILAFAEARGLAVIGDACEALGATYRGRPAGSFGDVSTFAFYPNKQMTTGEGGMLVTNDERIAECARMWSNQGRSASGAWLDHESLGYNYRIDELSAALGVSQFSRLDEFLRRRERVASQYTSRLEGLAGVRPPRVRDDVEISWFVYVVTLDEGVDRRAVVESMATAGIPSRAYFPAIHQQPYIVRRPEIRADGLEVTESVVGRTLALPFHNRVTEGEADLVVAALESALAGAAR